MGSGAAARQIICTSSGRPWAGIGGSAVLDGKQKRELKARLQSVVPSDDVLVAWMRTEEPDELLAAALARSLAGASLPSWR